MNKTQYEFIKLIENSGQTPRKTNKGLLAWIDLEQLPSLTKIVGYNYLCEGGIDVNLQSDCIVIDITDILKYLEIDEDVIESEGEV